MRTLFKPILRSIRYKTRQLQGVVPDRYPDFIILGATRSGTTYLHHMLQQHPDIFMPTQKKELHYFNHDARYQVAINRYLDMFHGYNHEKFIGEATPMYMEKGLVYEKCGRLKFDHSNSAVERIRAQIPDAKLIISLRNPVSRLISMYKKSYGQGKTEKSLKEVVRDEFSSPESFNFIRRNRYDIHLQNILQYFPIASIKVIIFEEWTKAPLETFGNLCRFIGANPKKIQVNQKTLYEESRNNIEQYQKHSGDNIEEMSYIDQEVENLIEQRLRPVKPYVERLLGRETPWV